MERESFEDTEVAKILNENFISIKVDREERPDIDAVYMNVCQNFTGSGGWPTSIFMDYEKKPFYAGTYFPKHSTRGMIGFIELLEKISSLYKNNRKYLMKIRDDIIRSLEGEQETISSDLDFNVIESSINIFKRLFHNRFGGFTREPKFPTPHQLIFLLSYHQITKDKQALEMAETTLRAIYHGGIYDHIGFGFCRYSTDNKWLVPHFEKMLYDNAQLIIAYSMLYQATQNNDYKTIVENVITFLLREMKSEEGGFYSAIDADSENEEGKFYLWTVEEIKEVIDNNYESFCSLYDITKEGNFEEKNIPNLIKKEITNENWIKECIEKLYLHRQKRIPPFLDDKIISGWNGLTIAALSIASKIFNNPSYANHAKEAADFILDKMTDNENILFTSYRENTLSKRATSDSYAYVIWGLCELYQSLLDEKYLIKAKALTNYLIKNFWDNKNGGLFLNDITGETLFMRTKEIYDHAVPSTNSITSYNLIKLSHLLTDFTLEEKAKEILKCFINDIKRSPINCGFSLICLLYLKEDHKDLVLYGGNKEKFTTYLKEINQSFSLFQTISLIQNHNPQTIFPNAENYKSSAPMVQICVGNKCQLPIEI